MAAAPIGAAKWPLRCGPVNSKNPGCLLALDLFDARLELARRFGADVTINPSKEDAVARVLALTEGYGCDVVIEATGNAEVITPCLHMFHSV